jgi:hypothetical protein
MENLGKDPDPADVVGTREHAEAVTHGRHPGTRDALQWLTFSHLPDPLKCFSRPFYELAVELIIEISDCPELTTALNKIIEAKDSGVRAGIKTVHGRAGSVPRPQEIVDPPATFENGPVDNRIGPNFGRLVKDRQGITEFGA